MKAIILAAGYATRLYPLTKDQPKALLPIGDKPILNYIIEQIERIDVIDEVYIIGNAKFVNHLKIWAEEFASSKEIIILNDGSVDNDTRLGAIGGIYFAIEKMNIQDEVLIICGDNLFTFSIAEYVEFYQKVLSDCVCVKEVNDAEKLKSFGVATVNENGIIVDFAEKPANPKSNLAVFGSYIYTKETMSLFEEYLTEGNNKDAPGNFVQWLHKIKPIYCFHFEGECFDIGTLAAYEEANEFMASLGFS
ncbi:MAG: nucleotidyltransferase family protein [Defluviitaleaceae bacterium]|nr:nucleotidyltransferase family protein [Defluviitaleaceae bacterium]